MKEIRRNLIILQILFIQATLLNAWTDEQKISDGNMCYYGCMQTYNCFEEESDCQNAWMNFLQNISIHEIDDCFEYIMLEDTYEPDPTTYTNYFESCHSQLASYLSGDAADYYQCIADCASNDPIYGGRDEDTGEDPWLTEDNVCTIKCYAANGCMDEGADCDQYIWEDFDENQPESCHLYGLMSMIDTYTDSEVSQQFALCLQEQANQIENEDAQSTAYCLAECAENEEFELERYYHEFEDVELCMIECIIEHDCIPGSDCFEDISPDYLYYHGKVNEIQSCEDLDETSDQDFGNQLSQCVTDYSQLFDSGSGQENSLLCWSDCFNLHGDDIDQDMFHKEEQLEESWDWDDEDDWEGDCDDKYCYYEIYKCWEDCTHIYCPDLICLDNGKEEYFNVSSQNSDCEYFNDRIFDLIYDVDPDISASLMFIDSYYNCAEFLKVEYASSSDPYVVDHFQCHANCADQFYTESDNADAYSSIFQFAIVNVIALLLITL